MPNPDAWLQGLDGEAIDDELRKRGLVPMVMRQAAFGKKKGKFIAVPEDQARSHEALGSAERTSATKERRAARHLEKVTKQAGLPRPPSVSGALGGAQESRVGGNLSRLGEGQ